MVRKTDWIIAAAGVIMLALACCNPSIGQTVPLYGVPAPVFKQNQVTGDASAQQNIDIPAPFSLTVQGSLINPAAVPWAAAGGTADAITVTYSPAITTLTDGLILSFRASGANATTAPTFSPNGLTAHPIVNQGGSALVPGDIPGAAAEMIVRYNLAGTRWELVNQEGIAAGGGSFTGAINEAAASVASAATTAIGAATGNYVTVTGTTTITAFDTVQAGTRRVVKFAGALTLTNNASIILPGGANIATAAGDVAEFVSEGAGVWRCANYTRAIGFGQLANSLAANVAMTSTTTYFDGPSVAQGTAGTWFASGTATVSGAAGDAVRCKLWDGTTIVASAIGGVSTGNLITSVSLSGFIVSPAANIKISCENNTGTTGSIIANLSGAGKDSTLTALRIN